MYQQPIMAEESLIIEVFLAAINAEDSTPAAQPVAAGFPYAADITLSASSTTAADADRAPTPIPSIGEHSRPTAPLQDNLAALPLISPATEDESISTFLGLLLPADDTHPAEEYHQHYSSPSGVLSPARHAFAASPSMQGIPHAATINNPAHAAFASQGISLTPLGHHYLPADEVLAADVAAVLITNHHAAMPPACDTFTANLCPHCLWCPHRFGSPPRHGRPLTSHRRHDGPAYLVLPLTGYRAAHRPRQFPPSALYSSKLDIPTAYIYVPLPLAHRFPTSLLFGDLFHAGTPHHFAAATPFSSTDAIPAGANHLSEPAHGASPFAAAPSATKHPLLLWMPISFDPGGQASNPHLKCKWSYEETQAKRKRRKLDANIEQNARLHIMNDAEEVQGPCCDGNDQGMNITTKEVPKLTSNLEQDSNAVAGFADVVVHVMDYRPLEHGNCGFSAMKHWVINLQRGNGLMFMSLSSHCPCGLMVLAKAVLKELQEKIMEGT
ncbi:hypothetical protein L7F22_032318 [Adiantum nelumboides]|nr:hypothetical protein [Adiantum nelumboides]